MPRLILLLLVILGACAPAPVQRVEAFRSQATPIWSAAAFDATRLKGPWRQTADFAPEGTQPCQAGQIEVASDGTARGALCLAGQSTPLNAALRVTGPGRLELAGMPGPIWVLWVDEGYRTMALGTPSGRFGMIVERGAGPTPSDRNAAAREILAWNGYALQRLR